MEARLLEVFAHPLVRYGVGALVVFVFLLFALFFLPPLFALAGPPPDLWVLGYRPEQVLSYLEALGEEGRRLYRLFLLADLGFAPLYGIALSGWLYHRYRSAAYARWPLVAAALDLGENLLFLAALSGHAEGLFLAGYLTFFKWILILYSFFALLLP